MFENTRAQFFPLKLPGQIIAQPVGRITYTSVQNMLMPQVFPHWDRGKRFQTPADRLDRVIKLRAIMNELHREHFVFYDGQQPVGWFYGRMENHLTFRMNNTGIIPAYRRKGLYSGFLHTLLAYIKEIGYERVVSYHHPNNRAILNAKLKAGFNVTGNLLQEDMGAVVQMTHFFYRDRFEAFETTLGLEPDFTQTDS